MADWSLPGLSNTYSDFLTMLKNRDADAAVGFDPAVTTPTNLPTNTIRWNSASHKWEKWSGTAWADLDSDYAITVNNADKLGGTAAASYAQQSWVTSNFAALAGKSTQDFAMNNGEFYDVLKSQYFTSTGAAAGDLAAVRSGGTTGVIFLDAAGDKYLFNDGNYYQLPGQDLQINGHTAWHAGNFLRDNEVAVQKAQHLLTGGGTMTWGGPGGNFSWSARFIAIDAGNGAQFSTNGYFDINPPAAGQAVTVYGGAPARNFTASGIVLNGWEALYYVLPIGSNNTSQPGNFVVASYNSGFTIPYNWILLAACSGDNTTLRVGTGRILASGQTVSANDGQLTTTGTAADSSKLGGQAPSYYTPFSTLVGKNKIINGNFDIWQRTTSGSGSAAASGYCPDRWFATFNASAWNWSRQAFALGQTAVPNNPQYWFRTAVSTATASQNYIEQRIESVATFSGQTVTVSFWAQAAAALTISLSLNQSFGTGGSPSAIVQTSSSNVTIGTTWAKYTVTFNVPSIAGKTLGTNGNDYLSLVFNLPASTTYTFDLAQVQLESGNTTTQFDSRLLQQELAFCQRYYQTIDLIKFWMGATSSGQTLGQTVTFQPMRANPTIAYSTVGYGNASGLTFESVSTNRLNLYTASSAAGGASMAVNGVTLNAEL